MSEDIQIYHGWGPCTHSEEEELEFEQWWKELFQDDTTLLSNEELDRPSWGGKLEWLVWKFLLDCGQIGIVSMDCDQWVAVTTEGKINGEKWRVRIQGDTFLIAIAESYRWWRESLLEAGEWMGTLTTEEAKETHPSHSNK